MTLDDVLRDIHAMREDLLVFERKFGVPTEMFYEAYCNGEEPADSSWVLDWSEWNCLAMKRVACSNRRKSQYTDSADGH